MALIALAIYSLHWPLTILTSTSASNLLPPGCGSIGRLGKRPICTVVLQLRQSLTSDHLRLVLGPLRHRAGAGDATLGGTVDPSMAESRNAHPTHRVRHGRIAAV